MPIKSLLFLLLFLLNLAVFGQDSLRLASPNGKLVFQFSLLSGGIPQYGIRYEHKAVILPSALGLRNNPNGMHASFDWDKNFALISSTQNSRDTTWRPVFGEREAIRDHYREMTITLQDTAKINGGPHGPMLLIVRAYDEGVAFRYFFPESLKTQVLELSEELTRFRLPPDSKLFATNHSQGLYVETTLAKLDFPAELPLTAQLPNDLWVSILTAQQTNFPRMRLRAEQGELVSQLFGGVVGTSPFFTPWRVVMVAEKPTQLLENNYLVQNLNPPNQIEDVSWLKPGKVMREITLSTTGAMRLLDFATEQKIDFIHFDAGWYGYEYDATADASRVNVDPRRNPVNDLDLPLIIRVAKEKGIGVILYVNHRALETQLDSLFPLYQKWGVAGVKFGFVQAGSHHWTAWLHDAVKKAAKYHLMVNVHDEYMPTGFDRTYPNLITQEGVRGNELFPDANHSTTLPFTRLLAGAADYTYCFNEPRLENTTAHQLVLSIINYSPWQYLYWYGKPEDYDNRAEIELWRTLPTVWQETRVPSGEPGEHVTVARRNGQKWYVGAVTNNNGRKSSITFDFLPKGKKYTAEIYEDDDAGGVRKKTVSVASGQLLEFDLLPRGGMAVRVKE